MHTEFWVVDSISTFFRSKKIHFFKRTIKMDVDLEPFEFFDLPTQLQYEYLLKMDLESINNLCAAADPTRKKHKDPRATVFFRELCEDDVGFWQEKLKVDFGLLTKKWPTWRKEYEKATQDLAQKLIAAARDGDVDKLKALLRDRRLTVDVRGFQGDTALMRAAGDGNVDVIKYLLSQGADINATNDFRVTPLMFAVAAAGFDRSNILRTVKLLVERGAELNARNEDGETALFYAFYDLRDYLKSQGATL